MREDIMRLKVKKLDVETGHILVGVMNEKDAEKLDLHPLSRIKIKKNRKIETVALDITEDKNLVPPGSIGLFKEVYESLNSKNKETVEIIPARKPLSVELIKRKLEGGKLSKEDLNQIIWDIVHNKITDIEMTYFVAACYINAMSIEETTNLTKAMVNQGDILKINEFPVLDKHCVGGVAGNRTTPIVVPIIAAAGLKIPKTSSRSITSPAGTADTMEVLTNVSLTIDKMKKIVKRVGGCLVWGGSLNLAPADDKIIKVERPLSVDSKSQLLASVMAKKASVSATHVLVDIPFGKGSKIEDKKRALDLKKSFIELGKRLGIKVKVVMTDGTQPIGNGIGPSLEARDVLLVLKNEKDQPLDLKNKSIKLAGKMLEMGNKAKPGEGVKLAKEILESGKAYKKMIEIIKNQGTKIINPDKVKLSDIKKDIKAKKSGTIVLVSNSSISKIARYAGAPKSQQAGIYLYKHIGDKVKKGEPLATIYATSKDKLNYALQTYKELDGIKIK